MSNSLRNQRRMFFSEANERENPTEESEQNEEKESEMNEEDEEEEFEDEEIENERTFFQKFISFIKYPFILGLFASLYYYLENHYHTNVEEPLYLYWFNKYFSFIYKPNMKEFLSIDPPLIPAIKPKTLIISFENMLYHKNYEAGSGIVIDLRPGLRDFLKDLSKKYEIILFSDEDSQFMEEVIATIDPYHMFLRNSFGREFFTVHRGRYLKDYDYFNRDFANVVIVDFNKKQNYNKHENLIVVSPYHGEVNDNTLNELKSFLLHCHKYDDVRKVISNFGGTECVPNFIEQRSKYTAKLKQKKGFIESLFGKK
jgi:hypothetical protein